MQSSIQSSPMKYAMHQTKNSCLFVCVTSMCSVKEMFVHFAEVERITGRELASIRLCYLRAWVCH